MTSSKGTLRRISPEQLDEVIWYALEHTPENASDAKALRFVRHIRPLLPYANLDREDIDAARARQLLQRGETLEKRCHAVTDSLGDDESITPLLSSRFTAPSYREHCRGLRCARALAAASEVGELPQDIDTLFNPKGFAPETLEAIGDTIEKAVAHFEARQGLIKGVRPAPNDGLVSFRDRAEAVRFISALPDRPALVDHCRDAFDDDGYVREHLEGLPFSTTTEFAQAVERALWLAPELGWTLVGEAFISAPRDSFSPSRETLFDPQTRAVFVYDDNIDRHWLYSAVSPEPPTPTSSQSLEP